ncbi:MAG: acetate/propionate family kinase [Inquilinus sp.]|nr:acetate/propionate family kinase [Inquilinus sp.]
MDALLTLNAGSSSLKFALYAAREADAPLYRGQIEGIGTAPNAEMTDASGGVVDTPELPASSSHDYAGLVGWLIALIGDRLGLTLVAAGRRVVHGGPRFAAPVMVDASVMAEVERLIPLARSHNPHNLAGMRAVAETWPDLPQVACFDTAFHRTIPWVGRAFALPGAVTDQGIQRYGFHGLSYQSIAERLPAMAGDRATGRFVVAHLGNGASLCALSDLKSVATTMGLTPLDGLVMGNRPGQLDPGVVLYLFEELGMSAVDVRHMLFAESGLLGVSGVSNDMRTLLDRSDPGAKRAVDLFVYRAVREIGAMAAVLGGLDGIVFTGGIGEHAARIRSSICAGAAWLGVALDEDANRRNATRISATNSTVEIFIVPTDEEGVIARETRRLCAA